MAVDFQICYPQELIPVSKVASVPGDSSLIEVDGEDFSAIESVSANEVLLTDLIVLSRTKLRARLPPGVTASSVRTVTVTSRRLVLTIRSLLRFKISRFPGKVTGILRMSQLFLKVLLTDPGTDIFNQTLGGGALKGLKRNYALSDTRGIVNDFAISVQTTLRQIIAIQSRQRIPPEERLVDAQITSSSFSPQEEALLATIELTNQAGQPAILNLVP